MNKRHIAAHLNRWLLTVALALFVGQATIGAAADGDAAKAQNQAAGGDQRIAQLIAQLGDPDFAVRERAEAELARIGLDAFDPLNEATKSDDIEIALRAQYLVRSLSVRWFSDDDSLDVARLLKNYGDLPDAERKSRMESLAKLSDGEGVPALCRLARFEENPELSKRAALLVMEQTEPTDNKARQDLAKRIVASIGASKRPAAGWLRTYAATLNDPAATIVRWEAIAKAEQETLANQPGETSREIVRDLFRWHVALLQKVGRDDEAVAAMRRTINLLDGSPEQVTEVVDWLVKREAWSVVVEVAERFPEVFNDSPLLLYRLAETQLKLDKPELAKQSAEKARGLHPENAQEHLLVGFELQQRGLFEWSEQEYRASLAATQPGTLVDFRTRPILAEMLHDLAREKDAAEVLKPLCDLMDKEDAVKAQAVNSGRDPESIYSRMHFFAAMHALGEKNIEEAKKRLYQGIENDPTDADVLIALYRLPNQDEATKEDVRKKIEAAAAKFREYIEEFTQSMEGAREGTEKTLATQEVATQCNQFAWLVANTFGDFDEALRCSHRSLELRPDTGGYLDTLGRCYYAKGDLENAVKYQQQAAKLDPHSQAIQRQLKLFTTELNAKKAAEKSSAGKQETQK
jgi:tetratricopeptide (TPR) repeat protein